MIQGRYTYKQQPIVCRWNCHKLSEALSALLHYSEEEAEEQLTQHFDVIFKATYMERSVVGTTLH